MTNKDVMIQIIYKAVGEGLAKLIKNGLAFTVMGFVIAGLVWGLLFMHKLHSAEMSDFKAEYRQMKNDHSIQLDDLRREIADCTLERMKDAARIARLEALLHINKNTH